MSCDNAVGLTRAVSLTVQVWAYSETRALAIAETALQGALVLAKSGRLELEDNVLRTL